MKMRLFAGLALIMLALSCSKADDTYIPSVSTPVSSMSARVSTAPFNTQDVTGSRTAELLAITGTKNAGTSKVSSISLTLKHLSGLTTYTINDTSNTASYTENGVTYHATSGVIMLTADNTIHVTGTFEFEASSGAAEKSLTGGTFDVYK